MASFYLKFEKMITSMKKIHVYMKQLYPKDMYLIRKRMKLEEFFEHHKYGKVLRKLKAEWLQFISDEK